MTSKTRLFIVLLLGGVGVMAALVWTPLRIQYHLYQLRSDEAHVYAGRELCALGVATRAPLLDMIRQYAAQPDVARFRPLAFDALVCLRINAPSADPDFTPDFEAIDAMSELYEHEPSADYREEMSAVNGLDQWTYFLLWERFALSRHPRALVFYSDLYWPQSCVKSSEEERDADASALSPESAARWCEHVAPVLRGWLEDGGPRIANRARVACVLDVRCSEQEAPAP